MFFLFKTKLFSMVIFPVGIFLLLLLCSINIAYGEIAYGENAAKIRQSIDATTKKLSDNAKTQNKIDNLDDSTRNMLAEYSAVLSQLESYRKYNEQLQKLIASQEKEIGKINIQIESIEETRQKIYPFLSTAIDSLDKFIEMDIPFLPEERRNRVIRLKNNLDRSDIALSEKLRQVFEAYRIELDYGKTIETYRGAIDNKSFDNQSFHFLRVGRIALFYISLDYSSCGHWDVKNKKWQSLDNSYIYSIKQGINIAEKKLPPSLLKLPLKTAGNNSGEAQ